jgi:hypothetical protein
MITPVEGKLVCSCNNVGQGNLEKAIQEGCVDFKNYVKNRCRNWPWFLPSGDARNSG